MRGNLKVQIHKADREIQDQRPEPHHLPLWVDTEAPTKVEQHHQSCMKPEQQCRGRPTCDYGGQSHKHLTRHKISERAQERAWLQAEGYSYSEWEHGAGRGSLHRMVRPLAAQI